MMESQKKKTCQRTARVIVAKLFFPRKYFIDYHFYYFVA